MKIFSFVVAIMLVFALALWANQESYKTRIALKELRKTQQDLSKSYSRLDALRTEWAYLNRPQRLRKLVELHFDQLALRPLRAQQFGLVSEVNFPKEEFIIAFEVGGEKLVAMFSSEDILQ
ncbi:MAG: cell division protein FtsL [Aestuariivita sp.]|nr:cell division protein FtsL [Aestuariivita sp.]